MYNNTDGSLTLLVLMTSVSALVARKRKFWSCTFRYLEQKARRNEAESSSVSVCRTPYSLGKPFWGSWFEKVEHVMGTVQAKKK